MEIMVGGRGRDRKRKSQRDTVKEGSVEFSKRLDGWGEGGIKADCPGFKLCTQLQECWMWKKGPK